MVTWNAGPASMPVHKEQGFEEKETRSIIHQRKRRTGSVSFLKFCCPLLRENVRSLKGRSGLSLTTSGSACPRVGADLDSPGVTSLRLCVSVDRFTLSGGQRHISVEDCWFNWRAKGVDLGLFQHVDKKGERCSLINW
jgi:hypothetical protein